jgi:hypothetical protein
MPRHASIDLPSSPGRFGCCHRPRTRTGGRIIRIDPHSVNLGNTRVGDTGGVLCENGRLPPDPREIRHASPRFRRQSHRRQGHCQRSSAKCASPPTGSRPGDSAVRASP